MRRKEGGPLDQDEAAIRAVQSDWFQATASGDVVRLRALMTDDVVFLTPGRPPFGLEEFLTGFEAGLRQVRISCDGELEEVIVAGDVAFTRGRLAVAVAPLAGGPVKRLTGHTLSVFRRRADGKWVLARDANLLAPATE